MPIMSSLSFFNPSRPPEWGEEGEDRGPIARSRRFAFALKALGPGDAGLRLRNVKPGGQRARFCRIPLDGRTVNGGQPPVNTWQQVGTRGNSATPRAQPRRPTRPRPFDPVGSGIGRRQRVVLRAPMRRKVGVNQAGPALQTTLLITEQQRVNWRSRRPCRAGGSGGRVPHALGSRRPSSRPRPTVRVP